MNNIIIKRATLNDLEEIVALFEEYRAFYQADANIEGSTSFIKERLLQNQSVIFLAEVDTCLAGFTQLFPTFSSVSLSMVYILNDLFVRESYRKNGVATGLIQTALEYSRMQECSRVSLSTASDNPAQKLYESLGFQESTFKFYNYKLIL